MSVILTVKFSTSPSAKTYDYLMHNPERIKLERGQEMKYMVGMGASGPQTTKIWVVDARKEEDIPKWVTTALEIQKDNILAPKKIAKATASAPVEKKPLPKGIPSDLPEDLLVFWQKYGERWSKYLAKSKKKGK